MGRGLSYNNSKSIDLNKNDEHEHIFIDYNSCYESHLLIEFDMCPNDKGNQTYIFTQSGNKFIARIGFHLNRIDYKFIIYSDYGFRNYSIELHMVYNSLENKLKTEKILVLLRLANIRITRQFDLKCFTIKIDGLLYEEATDLKYIRHISKRLSDYIEYFQIIKLNKSHDYII